jgi:hypothetical protein
MMYWQAKYASFSKVGGNYPLDLKIIWSSAWYRIRSLRKSAIYGMNCVDIARKLTQDASEMYISV